MNRDQPISSWLWVTVVGFLVCNCAAVRAQVLPRTSPPDAPDKDYSAELPRLAPLEPDQALASFAVHPGFRLEQVAAEPLVTDPTALSFDENGRLFVVEMRGYSEQEQEGLSRVRLLEDADGDGRFERSNIFADRLAWPTAVIAAQGGIYLGLPPEIWFFRDTDGDGRADERRLVFTGFGTQNVQGLLNSFTWGLDNRIHVATSSTGGAVRRPDQAESSALPLRGRNLAFDPRTLEFELTTGASQHGLSFDDWGTAFVCHNSDHLQQALFLEREAARNPLLPSPAPLASIALDGPQAEVFRLSPIEPWRVVRTRLRMQGIVPGVVEGGGRAAGYFTSATGVTVYRGDAWPAEYRGQVFVGDVGSNVVHRKWVDRAAVQFTARRIDEGVEFVASRDTWFRPVQFANAPDGTLYIADMYRETIEHPASLPPVIKRHLDLTSGRDRGRIYRLVPEGFVQRPPVRLGAANTAELVATLSHPNGWHRDAAARLLYERQDRTAVPLLVRLALEGPEPLGRLHALAALAGLEALSPEIVVAAMNDAHPQVVRQAIRLAESYWDDPAVLAEAPRLAAHPDPQVRYRLALSLGATQDPARLPALCELARRGADDPWQRWAVQTALAEGAAEVYDALVAEEPVRARAGGLEFLSALARQLGRQGRDSLKRLADLDRLAGDDPSVARALALAWIEGWAAAGLPVHTIADKLHQTADGSPRPIWQPLVDGAGRDLTDENAPVDARVRALETLCRLAALELPPLQELVDRRQPQELQVAALAALWNASAPDQSGEITAWLVERWPELSPTLKRRAGELWAARPERTLALLDAIEAKRLPAGELEPTVVAQLRAAGDPAVRERAASVLAATLAPRRSEVLAAYAPALERDGDRLRGQAHFRRVCAACHKLEGTGHELGPNLATLKNRGPEGLLIAILDPSREVNPQYLNYLCLTADGRSTSGMITAESATSVTLTRAEGAHETLLRVDIDELRSTGLSLMPEGLEQQLDLQAVADLIAYLMTVN